MTKNEHIEYIKNLSLIVSSLTLFLLPVFFLPNTTDFFFFPKQLLIVASTIFLSLLWGLRIIIERNITIKSTPFNLPLLLFGLSLLLSAVLSRNFYDSLIAVLPVVSSIAFFFLLINITQDKNFFNVTLSSLVVGTAISGTLAILSFYNIHIFPFEHTQNQYFNTFGSPIMHAAVLIPVFIFSALSVFRKYGTSKFKLTLSLFSQVFVSLLIAAAVFVTVYKVVTLPQKPIILPFKYGFQIAIAALNDPTRLFLSFLFGSGYGTFLTDFTRFNTVAFSREQNIWNFAFSFSSSYILELVATTGILGTLVFIFLIFKIIKTKTRPLNPLYVALVSQILLLFLIPFSFPLVFLFLTILAFYSSYLFLDGDKRVYDTTVALVALKRGLFSLKEAGYQTEDNTSRSQSRVLPVTLFVIIVCVSGFLGYFGIQLALSDLKFSESVSAQTLASGEKTYNLQRAAIKDFPYKSDYYRIFSQVNLSLANNIMSQATQNNASPSAETQKTVIQLLQQSINSARAGATISPLTSANWLNLSQIYRNLINVGQNAEQFAIASLNQAIALNQYNPLLYIDVGGIYYQLGQYENAENQFQIAVNLKPDLANAHYNLGHALEAKGELQKAIAEYQIVKELTKNDKANFDKISAEIDSLKVKAGSAPQTPQDIAGSEAQQSALQISTPSALLPPQKPELEIPGPPNQQLKPSSTPSPTLPPKVETSEPTPNL